MADPERFSIAKALLLNDNLHTKSAELPKTPTAGTTVNSDGTMSPPIVDETSLRMVTDAILLSCEPRLTQTLIITNPPMRMKLFLPGAPLGTLAFTGVHLPVLNNIARAGSQFVPTVKLAPLEIAVFAR